MSEEERNGLTVGRLDGETEKQKSKIKMQKYRAQEHKCIRAQAGEREKK